MTDARDLAAHLREVGDVMDEREIIRRLKSLGTPQASYWLHNIQHTRTHRRALCVVLASKYLSRSGWQEVNHD